jgi:hypothetical protein
LNGYLTNTIWEPPFSLFMFVATVENINEVISLTPLLSLKRSFYFLPILIRVTLVKIEYI